MPTQALQIDHLVKRYAKIVAVDDISFAVARGEIVGLLGPNGAGKTSTISMILGLLEPTAGSIAIEGVDLAHDRATALAHANFAAVYATLPGNLTVAQNLRVFGLIYAIEDLSARIEALIEQFDLQTLRDTRAGLLSSGEQTRLALAKAMINRPRLLLLDEPTASLDPSAAATIRAQIRAMATEGGTGILWTSHNMQEVAHVCDRVLFLSHGKLLLEGDPKLLPHQHGVADLEELFVRLAREPFHKEIAR
ncbi:MAG TPA: ABC transporter ATP-binding protein [Polyangiales bacterium]|nr:ABC transporter ATP-binding protein [Polyangiales bacterium]